jgi:hypothetical protein
MSKRNETELRRRLDLLSKTEPSPQASQRALDRVRRVLSETPARPANRSARAGGTLTRSRLAGLAVAAAVLVATGVFVFFFTGSLDGTTAAYARVTAAVRKAPWMRIRYSGYRLDDAGNRITAEGERDDEVWYSFNAQVMIYRNARGAIDYYDYAKQEIHEYNPVAKRVVVSSLPTGRRPLRPDSPGGWLEKSIEQITSDGGSVARRRGQYNGREVEILEITSAVKRGVAAIRSTVYVDRMTSLPIAEERTYINTNTGNPQLVETAVFDYPEQGPTDIYGLGLSRDIPSISSLPLPSWSDIRMTYEPFRFRPLAQRYVAVVARWMIGLVESVEICCADGARFREERHFLYRRGIIGPQWEEMKTELGDTPDSLLRWSRDYRARGHITISLWIGKRAYHSQRDERGSWGPVEEVVLPQEMTEDFWSMCPIAGLAWPEIRGYADIIQDDYAREHGLIRVEGERETFYLNPQRDYICQQRVPLGRDRTEMTEFAQTETGRWYPRKIDDGAFKYTIYLDTDPEFPAGLFDPNSLPKAKQP